MIKFNPFPEINSKKLILRQILETDYEAILYLRSDETINKFIERPENRKTRNSSDAIKFIQQLNENIETNKSISWGITLKNNPKIIGTICLWNFSENHKVAEVGYDLEPDFQGKGIMSESLKSVLEYGFKNLNLDIIEAYTHQKNENSKTLLARNNFKLILGKKDEGNLNNVIFEIKNPILNK
ncbi:GNAT family N-acetyltransferase [uncultured Flavobacterium sp.]|uniref:GNAT family N-acetyltransferase n=1 Tax=uncultured Flavobacterium sp. TaxID=165435 RepID=UPI0030ECD27B|tara:strand:+ start:108662 stop:109210 length:549 start_codon:yes stop_codon:yes gene_type:complete